MIGDVGDGPLRAWWLVYEINRTERRAVSWRELADRLHAPSVASVKAVVLPLLSAGLLVDDQQTVIASARVVPVELGAEAFDLTTPTEDTGPAEPVFDVLFGL